MLEIENLKKIAQFKRLSSLQAEKDYIQDAVLFSLYQKVSDEFVFKGGTCLYKCYSLLRFSEDLDFTVSKNVKIGKIVASLLENLEFLNIKGQVKETREYLQQINVHLLFKGPLYRGRKSELCFLPLNLSLRERPLMIQKEGYHSLYPEIPAFDLFLMSEPEILAEKVRAIYTRNKPRDVYDFWFLLKKKIHFDRNLVEQKLKLYDLHFDISIFKERLQEKEKLWLTDLKPLVPNDVADFNIVIEEIVELMKVITNDNLKHIK